MKVSRSTFANNTGQLSPSVVPSGPDSDTFFASGGAIFNAGSLLLTNSTVYGNTVDGEGGAVFTGPHAVSTVINCTVSDNAGVYSGGFDGAPTATLKLGNSIVAGNMDADSLFALSTDVSGPSTSLGHNLIGISAPSFWLASDFVGTPAAPKNPQLGPLANNGGPTETMSIAQFQGLAYNDGSNALANQYGLTTDQRGQPRIQHGTVDIGAYEAAASIKLL